MTRKLTTTEFIERSHRVHGNLYDYSSVKYENKNTPVIIKCKKHGEFNQKPAQHIHDRCGCPRCGNNYKPSCVEVIDRFENIHGTKYDYSAVIYKKMLSKVDIICPIHGKFSQTPADHLQNHGCPDCKSDMTRYTWDEIYDNFISTHGNQYVYNKDTFVNNSSKMEITCAIHGKFWQKPELHKNGAGCKKCNASGGPGKYCETIFERNPELKNKQGLIYFIKLKDEDGTEFFKIGITSDLKTRIAGYIRHNNAEIIWTINDILYNCFVKEQEILEKYKDYLYKPKKLLNGGRNECLIIMIEKL